MGWETNTAFSTVLDEFYDSGFDYIQDEGKEARAKRWVNQSYQELCGLEDWPFLRATVSGSAPLALTSLGDISTVVDTVTNNPLVEADEKLLTQIDAELTEPADATYYYLSFASEAPELHVWPVSTNSLTVVYYKTPTELSADADELIVPNAFIDVVVLGAVARGLLDGTDTAAQYQFITQALSSRIDSMRKQLLPNKTYQDIQFYSEDW